MTYITFFALLSIAVNWDYINNIYSCSTIFHKMFADRISWKCGKV